MEKKKVKWSFWYWFIKQGVLFWLPIYWRRIKGHNKENLPKNKPVIYASNHPNAFLDAITISCFAHQGQTTFLVRSDVFKPGNIDKFLRNIKMLPIYRAQDGGDIAAKNEEIFNICYERLGGNGPFIIFVEGSHSQVRKQRAVKKGISRIAFGAEAMFDFELGVEIIPVGFNYSKFDKPGGNVLLNFGDPIPVAKYIELFKEKPSRAQLLLKNEVEESLRDQVIDIRKDHLYKSIDALREILRHELLEHNGFSTKGKRNLRHEFEGEKRLITAIEAWDDTHPEEALALHEEVISYTKLLQKNRIRDYVVARPWTMGRKLFTLLWMTLTFPIFLFGFVHNILPFWLSGSLVNKKIRDKHFHSSLKFGGALVLFPIMWLLFLIAALIFMRPMWLIPIYVAVSFPAGLFALMWYRQGKKMMAMFRFGGLKRKNPKEHDVMVSLRKSIVEKAMRVFK